MPNEIPSRAASLAPQRLHDLQGATSATATIRQEPAGVPRRDDSTAAGLPAPFLDDRSVVNMAATSRANHTQLAAHATDPRQQALLDAQEQCVVLLRELQMARSRNDPA